MMLNRFFLILACGLAMMSGNLYSEDTPAAPTAQTNATPATPLQQATPNFSKNRKHRRSRLTRDTSERAADKRRLLLATGEDKAVDVDFDIASANGITVGNPQLVATTLVKAGEDRQLVFKPLKKGETTVVVRDAEGTIQLIFTVVVADNNLLRRAAEIRDLLKDIEGIDVRIVGQKIVVDGEVLVPADYGRLLNVVTDETYSGVVLNLAGLSNIALQFLAKKIQEDINTFAPNIRTRVVNGVIFLEGQVDTIEYARRAGEVAKLYLPDVKPGNPVVNKDRGATSVQKALVQNFVVVVRTRDEKRQDKLVRITAHLVELAKDYNKVFSFKWAPGFTPGSDSISFGQTTQGSTGASGPSFAGTISSLFPRLESLQTAGYARILKVSNVITRSGQPAELNEQTEYPFLTIGPNGEQIPSSKNVGLAIGVTPQVMGQTDDIDLDLHITQSSVKGRATAGAQPTTINHTVKTKIYIKSNESAAVAGVVSSDLTNAFNKDDPFVSGTDNANTRPLFNLLRSKNYNRQKSQFVIFVTPSIVDNASDGTEDLKRNFRVRAR